MSKKKPFYKQKWFIYAFAAFIILNAFATSGKEEQEQSTPVEQAEEVNQPKEVEEVKTEPVVEEKAPETVQMTKEEVLAMVEIDYEAGPYENGTFILKDNTFIRADMYLFNEGNGYTEGIAIFTDGKLDRLKLWLIDDSGIEEAFAQFGIYDTENIERSDGIYFVYEYNFSGKFATDNIHQYPSELD